eukprot:7883172-Pyramimonas_sp.AAC.1
MLDRVEGHAQVLEELPKRSAEDGDEAALAKWIRRVSTGQNVLSEENRARFDAPVNRGAWRRRTAQECALEVRAFVEQRGRAPQRVSQDENPRERQLQARWVEHVRDRSFQGVGDRWRAELKVALDFEHRRLQAWEAWCEERQRWPREKAEGDAGRKLANLVVDRERGERAS